MDILFKKVCPLLDFKVLDQFDYGIISLDYKNTISLKNDIFDLLDSEYVLDLGYIKTLSIPIDDQYLTDEAKKLFREKLYGKNTKDFPISSSRITETIFDQIYLKNKNIKILTIGDDQRLIYSSLKSYVRLKRRQQKRIGIIHFGEQSLGASIIESIGCTNISKELLDTELFVEVSFQKDERKFTLELVNLMERKGIQEWYMFLDMNIIEKSKGLRPDQIATILGRLKQKFCFSGMGISIDCLGSKENIVRGAALSHLFLG